MCPVVVQLFIKHLCGWDDDNPSSGLFRKPSTYYGTVEQQGCMTLHLQLLLWIEGAPSPQQLQDRLKTADEVFECKITEYLESCHVGEFQTGAMEEVRTRVPVTTLV
jgi:hypothetical protein